MGKKELSELDYYKLDAREVIEHLNQVIKNLGPMMYLTYNGMIYIKSNSKKIERIARYVDKNAIPTRMCGALYDTGEVAIFNKDYRISKVLINILSDSIVIGQKDDAKNPDAVLKVNKIMNDRDDELEAHKVSNLIIPGFYNKFFNIVTDFDIDDEFIRLSENDIELLKDGEMLEILARRQDEYIRAYITKESFPCINKSSEMSYYVLDVTNELDAKCAYMIIREYMDEESLYVYSLIAVYQNI